MKYQIDKTLPEPAYLQLYHEIRQDITENVLAAGARLPSKRQVAEELEIAVITVEHAYQLLVDEGYAESRPRSGFYVRSRGYGQTEPPARRAALSEMQVPSDGAAADFPFSVWTRTMRRVMAEYDRKILIKAPNSGLTELKEAIVGFLRRTRGLQIFPDQVIIGSGAEYLYSLVVQLLGRDRIYALEDPSYDRIRRVYEANGARVELLEMGPDGIVSYELQDCEAGVLHVTPFHSFPSGVTATGPKRREYAAWARTRGAFIVEDDYDAELASPTRQIETIYSLAPESVIYINTFSKILAPSMRTGYMVLPERLVSVYNEVLGFYSCTVPVFDQAVLAEFIDEGHLERLINRRRKKLKKGS